MGTDLVLEPIVEVVKRDSETGEKYGVRVQLPRIRYRSSGFLGLGKSIPYHDGYLDRKYAGYDLYGFPSLRHMEFWGSKHRAERLAQQVREGDWSEHG